jgi:hypothetical protein
MMGSLVLVIQQYINNKVSTGEQMDIEIPDISLPEQAEVKIKMKGVTQC